MKRAHQTHHSKGTELPMKGIPISPIAIASWLRQWTWLSLHFSKLRRGNKLQNNSLAWEGQVTFQWVKWTLLTVIGMEPSFQHSNQEAANQRRAFTGSN